MVYNRYEDGIPSVGIWLVIVLILHQKNHQIQTYSPQKCQTVPPEIPYHLTIPLLHCVFQWYLLSSLFSVIHAVLSLWV